MAEIFSTSRETYIFSRSHIKTATVGNSDKIGISSKLLLAGENFVNHLIRFIIRIEHKFLNLDVAKIRMASRICFFPTFDCTFEL